MTMVQVQHMEKADYLVMDIGRPTLTTNDCSTQTAELDAEFFSVNTPIRLQDSIGIRRSAQSDWTGLLKEFPEDISSDQMYQPGQLLTPPIEPILSHPRKLHNCEPGYVSEGVDPDHQTTTLENNLSPERTLSNIHQSTVKGVYLEKVFLKPVFSYACLIAMALEQSPERKLPVNEIYNFMQWEFPYFRTAPEGWKNSVRHNLSLNKAFYKIDRTPLKNISRSSSLSGKGCYWVLDPEKEETMKQEILRWKTRHPEAVRASMANPANFWNPPNLGLGSPPFQLRHQPSRPRYNPYPRSVLQFSEWNPAAEEALTPLYSYRQTSYMTPHFRQKNSATPHFGQTNQSVMRSSENTNSQVTQDFSSDFTSENQEFMSSSYGSDRVDTGYTDNAQGWGLVESQEGLVESQESTELEQLLDSEDTWSEELFSSDFID